MAEARANVIPVTFPKKAVLREITSKDGTDLLVIKLPGKYRGYEFIYPAAWVHVSEYDNKRLFTYMNEGKTVTANKRKLNEATGKFENIDSKEISPEELKELFAPKRSSK